MILGTPGEKIDLRGALQPAAKQRTIAGELLSACAEPYGVSRSAGASRRCPPWYSAASEAGAALRQFIAGSAEAKAPTTRGYHHA